MEEEKGSDERLAAICQVIRSETLEPAKRDAEQIRHIAERDAAAIISSAKQQADHLLQSARQQLAQERELFDASLEQAAKQAIGLVKDRIEKSLFNPGLSAYLDKEFADEKKTAKLLDIILDKLMQEGFEGDLSVWIGTHLAKEEVIKNLGASALHRITKEGLRIGEQPYGFVIKLEGKHLSIEVTPEAIRELLAPFLRTDFRTFLFRE